MSIDDSMKDYPKISVITVVRNGESSIEKTIKSVLNQGIDCYEYIVIDGGSNDRTVEIIRGYESKLTSWISEPDNGLYDAMNKGWMKAIGEYVIFLNAGDKFYSSSSLEKVAQLILKGADVVVGDYYIDVGGRLIYAKQQLNSGWDIKCGKLPSCHQAMIYKRTLLDDVGGFSEKYHIASDYEWLARLYKMRSIDGHGVSLQAISCPVAIFSGGGTSEMNRYKGAKEVSDIIYKYFGLASYVHFCISRGTKLLSIAAAEKLGIADFSRRIYRNILARRSSGASNDMRHDC